MVFIIANCVILHTPDIAVDPVFSPSGLVRLNSWTGTHFGFETFKHWLRVLSNSMQEFHQFSQADLEAVQRPEHLLKLAQGQTHHGAQIGDHTGKSHPNTSLSEHLLGQVHRGFMPFLAVRAPPFVDPMLGDFHHWQRRYIDDFTTTSQTDATQAGLTVWTLDEPMFDNLRGDG